jgi:hypothetical protein
MARISPATGRHLTVLLKVIDIKKAPDPGKLLESGAYVWFRLDELDS